MPKTKKPTTPKRKPTISKKFTYALGRRKTATARVRLFSTPTVPGVEGKHQLIINGQPARSYFPGDLNKINYCKPFTLTQSLTKFSASVKVHGSGKQAQLGATVHGISRALSTLNEQEYRKVLKKEGLLTRDPRAKERRKVGTGGKARRQKQSPKR